MYLCGFALQSSAALLVPASRLYPHYVDPAPCPCDLKPGKCDVYCCCDPDCADPELNFKNLTCVEGAFGGFADAYGLFER